MLTSINWIRDKEIKPNNGDIVLTWSKVLDDTYTYALYRYIIVADKIIWKNLATGVEVSDSNIIVLRWALVATSYNLYYYAYRHGNLVKKKLTEDAICCCGAIVNHIYGEVLITSFSDDEVKEMFVDYYKNSMSDFLDKYTEDYFFTMLHNIKNSPVVEIDAEWSFV